MKSKIQRKVKSYLNMSSSLSDSEIQEIISSKSMEVSKAMVRILQSHILYMYPIRSQKTLGKPHVIFTNEVIANEYHS